MSNPTRTTTVNYRFNHKVGDYQPTSMVVVVTEELDKQDQVAAQATLQAELKAKFEKQEREAEPKKESKEDAQTRHIASRVV